MRFFSFGLIPIFACQGVILLYAYSWCQCPFCDTVVLWQLGLRRVTMADEVIDVISPSVIVLRFTLNMCFGVNSLISMFVWALLWFRLIQLNRNLNYMWYDWLCLWSDWWPAKHLLHNWRKTYVRPEFSCWCQFFAYFVVRKWWNIV